MAVQLRVLDLGSRTYGSVLKDMQELSAARPRDCTDDQLWFVQHPAVFTLGQAAKPEHVLAAGDIPVLQSDRGGEVTYHGPGQLVGYLLLNLAKRKLGVRALVDIVEQSLIELLKTFQVDAETRTGAPGVYVADRKIASLGFRVRRGFSYHGFSLNIDVDKEHFSRINPCGYPGLEVCNLAEMVSSESTESLLASSKSRLADILSAALSASLR